MLSATSIARFISFEERDIRRPQTDQRQTLDRVDSTPRTDELEEPWHDVDLDVRGP